MICPLKIATSTDRNENVCCITGVLFQSSDDYEKMFLEKKQQKNMGLFY